MFYCTPCANERGWPGSLVKSRGSCELCGKTAMCFDRPSYSFAASVASSAWAATLPSAKP